MSVRQPQRILEVESLRVEYRLRRSIVPAVDGVDLSVGGGERVGVVGESGSGKSTLAFSIMRLVRPPGVIAGGSIRLHGADLTTLSENEMIGVRGSEMAMIYQDPLTYLNPVLRVGDQIAESLISHRRLERREARNEAIRLLERLHLPSPRSIAEAFPHQLSGGQRQRIIIGIAIACRPKLLIADEPTTALDVTVQAEILKLIDELVVELGMSLLLISHDLAIVAALCERVYVMYAGRFVETGPIESVYRAPKHPYTEALLGASVTLLEPRSRFRTIPGAPPDLAHLRSGCRFADRCPLRMDICAQYPPAFPVGSNWTASCWVHADARTDESPRVSRPR